jgi:hypothetical protein
VLLADRGRRICMERKVSVWRCIRAQLWGRIFDIFRVVGLASMR